MKSPGMSTILWGPLAWGILTDMAIRMDQHPNVDYSAIWQSLKTMLPCKYCRQSYRKFLREDPPQRPYTRWIFVLHNKVNRKLDKPLFDEAAFRRRIHVYGAFSSATTWWDFAFILAMNYDPATKRQAYQRWGRLMRLMSTVLPYFIVTDSFPASALVSRLALLKWLVERYNSQHGTTHQTSFFVHKYSQAISHQSPEELARLCGPLIVQCERLEKRTK